VAAQNGTIHGSVADSRTPVPIRTMDRTKTSIASGKVAPQGGDAGRDCGLEAFVS
jgi:hypothetical protein